MTPFEYALGLFSVLIGLALADIAQKAHRLIRDVATVTWDARVLITTVLVTITIVRMWFDVWSIHGRADILVFGFYLTMFVEMMILFVVAANSLPDDVGRDCDLRAFYEGNSRTFWWSFAAFHLSFLGHWLYFTDFQGSAVGWTVGLARPLCCAVLASVRHKPTHFLLISVLIVAEVALNWGATFD
jgi:hypothetical protein